MGKHIVNTPLLVEWYRTSPQESPPAVRILVGPLLAAAAAAAYSPARGLNRRPKSPEPVALPFGHCSTRTKESPLLGTVSATDKNPNCVFLSD